MRSTLEDAWVDEHFDLLQNIEAMIAGQYRSDPEIEDWDVSEALSAAIQKYNAEVRGRAFNRPRLNERAVKLLEAILDILAFRQDLNTPAEILHALKEIRTSVRRHSKLHGKRGYLDFIIHYT